LWVLLPAFPKVWEVQDDLSHGKRHEVVQEELQNMVNLISQQGPQKEQWQ
jgi:hypothetical protein